MLASGMKALCLAGGGVKGAYQVGALRRWLLDEGRDYDIVCGVSVGALNTAVLAQAPLGDPRLAYRYLVNSWEGLRCTDLYRHWFPLGPVHSLWTGAWYTSAPLAQRLAKLDARAIATSGRTVQVGAVSWTTGRYRTVTGDHPEFLKWALASASLPVFLPPVPLEGDLWVDGGVRNSTPLSSAIELGAREIDVILCSDPEAAPVWKPAGFCRVLSSTRRLVDLLSDEVARTDLQVCGLKNLLAQAGAAYRDVSIRVLAPSQPITRDVLDFTPSAIEELQALGYHDACNV